MVEMISVLLGDFCYIMYVGWVGDVFGDIFFFNSKVGEFDGEFLDE